MANLGKHPKRFETLDADFSDVPTRGRSSHLVGRYIKNRENDCRVRTPAPEPGAFVLRLENLPATPGNVDRVREQVERLNRHLAASGTPFRLRLL